MGRDARLGGQGSGPRRALANPFPTLVGPEEAREYEDVRPGYPPAAYDAIFDYVRSQGRPVRDAVDVGAGTGQFTRGLLKRGINVSAVEPADAMRQVLAEAASVVSAEHEGGGRGSLRVVDASAEDTGLPNGSVDLVAWAQCSHWLNMGKASEEAARILRPRGTLALVTNQLAVGVPWVHRLSRIMRSGDVARADRPPNFGSLFTSVTFTAIEWEQTLTVLQCMKLARTRSSYLAASAAYREKMQANLSWYLLDHLALDANESFALPYVTFIWVASVKGDV